MNSGKRPCGTRLKPDNSVFARWFLWNYPREAPPARACLSGLNRWPSPMKIFRPRRRIWPAVFIGNTAAKEDRGSILSRISSSPPTHKCNAIVWPRSIAAISGATSRASAYFRRSKPTICPSTARIACQRNRSAAKIGRPSDQLIPEAKPEIGRYSDQMALRQIGRPSDQLISGIILVFLSSVIGG